MRRSSHRQKRNGDEQDWCNKWARRAIGLTRQPGLGKYVKRNMARRRRRESRRYAQVEDEDEDPHNG